MQRKKLGIIHRKTNRAVIALAIGGLVALSLLVHKAPHSALPASIPYIHETSTEYIAPVGSLMVKIPKSVAPFAPEAALSVPIKGKRYLDSSVTFSVPFAPKNEREAAALRELTPPWIKNRSATLVIAARSAYAAPSTSIHNMLSIKHASYDAYGCTLQKDGTQLYSLDRYKLTDCAKGAPSPQDRHFFMPAEIPIVDWVYIECQTAKNNRLLTGTCAMTGYLRSNVALDVQFPMDLLYRWSEMWSLANTQLKAYTANKPG